MKYINTNTVITSDMELICMENKMKQYVATAMLGALVGVALTWSAWNACDVVFMILMG